MKLDLNRPRLADLLDQPAAITVPETAAILGVCSKTLFEDIAGGNSPIKTIKVGRRHIVPVPALLALLGADVDVLDALRRVFETTRAGPPGPAAATDTADPSPKGND